MKPLHALLLPLTLLAVACGASPAGSRAPAPAPEPEFPAVCLGDALLVEEAAAACWVPRPRGPARRPEVAFAIVSPLVAPSGQKTPFVLEIRNITDSMIPVIFDDDPLAFVATASNEDATTASAEGGCPPVVSPGSGGPERALRLFLRPHGAVRKTVLLDATQRVVRPQEPGGACVEDELGPLPPGNYELEIALPASWLPTESDDRVDPFVRAPIRVTAH